MKKNANKKPANDEMRPEYDLRGGVRGKYYERYKQGTNVVLLEPDIAKVFRDSATVNEALSQYLSEHGTPSTKRNGLAPTASRVKRSAASKGLSRSRRLKP